MRTLSRLLFALIIVWGCLFPNDGKAEEWINPGDEKFCIVGGAFFPAFDTDLRVDNTNLGMGNEIDLQDDLGFSDTQTTGYVSGWWRFAPRHRIAGWAISDLKTNPVSRLSVIFRSETRFIRRAQAFSLNSSSRSSPSTIPTLS